MSFRRARIGRPHLHPRDEVFDLLVGKTLRFLEQIENLLERPSEFLTFDPLDSVARVRSR